MIRHQSGFPTTSKPQNFRSIILMFCIIAFIVLSFTACGGGGGDEGDDDGNTTRELKSIEVTPINPSIALGTSQQFIATGIYSDNSKKTLTTSVTWGSSDASVATISNAAGTNGYATSVSTGTCTITAASGTISGTTMLPPFVKTKNAGV